MKHLIIIGTGGFAREVYWYAQNSIGYANEWDIKGFLDGNIRLPENQYALLDAPVLGNVHQYEFEADDVFCCAIANVHVKKTLTKEVEKKGGQFVNIIHKTAYISPRAILGTGIILCPFVGISCDTKVGNYVMFNSYSGMGHDASVGDYTSIMGRVDITGGVEVGESTFWGSGSRALPHSKIEDFAIIGAASVILKKVKKNQKVFGVPAMPI